MNPNGYVWNFHIIIITCILWYIHATHVIIENTDMLEVFVKYLVSKIHKNVYKIWKSAQHQSLPFTLSYILLQGAQMCVPLFHMRNVYSSSCFIIVHVRWVITKWQSFLRQPLAKNNWLLVNISPRHHRNGIVQ